MNFKLSTDIVHVDIALHFVLVKHPQGPDATIKSVMSRRDIFVSLCI